MLSSRCTCQKRPSWKSEVSSTAADGVDEETASETESEDDGDSDDSDDDLAGFVVDDDVVDDHQKRRAKMKARKGTVRARLHSRSLNRRKIRKGRGPSRKT
jgi:hypothetical protein